MMLLLSCLLSVISLIAMENNNNARLLPAPLNSVPSLKDIAFEAVAKYFFEKKITGKQIAKLPQDVAEVKIRKFTSILNKRYELSSLTPDHRYILGNESNDYFLRNVKNQQEIPIDLLGKEQEKPALIALSPSGNLVACFSDRKIWIKDIQTKKLLAETHSSMPTLVKRITFIGERNLLLEDGYFLHPFSIKDNGEIVDGPIATFRLLGFLHRTGEFLTLNESTLMKSENGYVYSAISSVNDSISRVKPAIYEPDMLMAYEHQDFNGFIRIISLKEKQQLAPLAELKTASTIVALSFVGKGSHLMTANIDMIKKIPQIVIYDWKSADKLYTYEPSNDIHRISAISYTDQPSQYSCIFEMYNNMSLPCLYSFDPKKAIIDAIIPKQSSNDNNNNSTKDTGKK